MERHTCFIFFFFVLQSPSQLPILYIFICFHFIFALLPLTILMLALRLCFSLTFVRGTVAFGFNVLLCCWLFVADDYVRDGGDVFSFGQWQVEFFYRSSTPCACRCPIPYVCLH